MNQEDFLERLVAKLAFIEIQNQSITGENP